MFCPECGSGVPDNSKFCLECGTRMPQRGVTPAPAGGTLSGGGTVVGGGTFGPGATPVSSPPPPPAAVLPRGEAFAGRYRIERPVGEGGMGTVYLATDEYENAPVCLKVIRPELVADEALAKRFLREGTIARRIRHPNVVSVFDVARHGEATYITMEYLEGKSLRAWLRENRRAGREIPLSAAVSILTQVLAGLAEAHRQNIVHRDLKPENVMLVGDPLAGECRLKLLDFGIARALDAGDALTRTGAVVGTPAYMAPEQRAGADAMGPPADLWAAGAMLYEILTEVPPEGRWPAPSEVRPDLPAALDAVVSKALEHHPKRRYASSGEMASALGSLGKTTEKVNEGRLNEAIEDDMVQGLMAQVLRDPEAGLAEARPLQ